MPRAPYFYPAAGCAAEAVSQLLQGTILELTKAYDRQWRKFLQFSERSESCDVTEEVQT